MTTDKIVTVTFVAFTMPETEQGIASKKKNNNGKIDILHELFPEG